MRSLLTLVVAAALASCSSGPDRPACGADHVAFCGGPVLPTCGPAPAGHWYDIYCLDETGTRDGPIPTCLLVDHATGMTRLDQTTPVYCPAPDDAGPGTD